MTIRRESLVDQSKSLPLSVHDFVSSDPGAHLIRGWVADEVDSSAIWQAHGGDRGQPLYYLASDLERILGEFGVPYDPESLPRAGSVRGSARDSARYWSGPRECALVESIYSRERARFGYTLDKIDI